MSKGKVLPEYDGLTKLMQVKHIHAGDWRIAMRNRASKLHFYLNDHLGSARVVLDTTGTIKDKYHYLAYGKPNEVAVLAACRSKTPLRTVTFEPRTCDNLISPSLVTITDSSAVRDFMTKLETNLTNAAFSLDQKEWGHYTIDPRVCCALFTSKDSLAARLAFSRTGLMQYEGKTYRVDFSLWNMVLRYLPARYLED